MQNNIPPIDDKHYWFNEEAQSWVEVSLDSSGFALTPDRILALKPYSSWIRNEEDTDWVPPIPRPDDIVDVNGHIVSVFGWDEETTSWKEHSLAPYPSWVINETGTWAPPIAKPDESGKYIWNEEHTKWIRDPQSFEPAEAFWDEETKDFISILEVMGFTRTAEGIDAAFKEQAWPSWTQGEDGKWRAPLPYPNDGKFTYVWDEFDQEWFSPVPMIDPSIFPHNQPVEQGAVDDTAIRG